MALAGLQGVFQPYESMVEQFLQNGYVEGGDNRQYNREAVKDRLLELCEEELSETKQILWWEKEGEEETLFLAFPVMMSLLLEEYECTKQLLQLGYAADTGVFQTQKYATNVGRRDKALVYHTVNLQQLILARELPVEILGLLLESVKSKKDFFLFERDYWRNPFLMEDVDAGTRKTIPSLCGMKHLHKHFPEWLDGLLQARLDSSWKHGVMRMEARPRHQLFEALLEMTHRKVDELQVLFEVFRPTFYYNKFKNDQRETDYWIKKLPMIYKACEGEKQCESLYFEMLVTLLYEMIDANKDYEKGRHKERYERLKEAIAAGKPKHYTPEDYLLYTHINKKKNERPNSTTCWTKYLEIWKYIIKEPLLVARNSEELWLFLRDLFRLANGITDEDDFYDIYEEEELTEENLMSYILLLEEIDTRIAEDENEDEYKDLLVELVCGIMQLESEEVVLACLKNKLIPKEGIKACINTALKFGKLQIVPPLIMAQ